MSQECNSVLKNSRCWEHHEPSTSRVRISSDAFEELLVYPLFGRALTFSKELVVSRLLNRS